MIVSDKHRFVIATPSKCGTHSMESLAKRVAKKEGEDVMRLVRSQHRMDLPEGTESYARILVVRNPYDRLVSVYQYLTDPVNYSQWSHKTVKDMSFAEFVQWFANKKVEVDKKPNNTHRSPHLWTNSLTQNYDIFIPDFVLPIEDALFEFPSLMEQVTGVEAVAEDWPDVGHANPTRKRKEDGRGLGEYYGDTATLAVANAVWCHADTATFDVYELRA